MNEKIIDNTKYSQKEVKNLYSLTKFYAIVINEVIAERIEYSLIEYYTWYPQFEIKISLNGIHQFYVEFSI